MMITINLSETLDAELRSGKKRISDFAKASREFHELLTSHGMKAVPLFPDPHAPGFARIWHIACPDQEAPALIEKLAHMRGVEAAYSKPADELPSAT